MAGLAPARPHQCRRAGGGLSVASYAARAAAVPIASNAALMRIIRRVALSPARSG